MPKMARAWRAMNREPNRPRPAPSELTAPYWEHAARRELVRPLCEDCGRSFFTPQVACPRCLSEAWTWAASSGRGVVYSHSVCHRGPEAGFETPYVLAVVDVEEGWTMLTNVVGCPPADVTIGMAVRVTWMDLGEGVLLPVFEPEDA